MPTRINQRTATYSRHQRARFNWEAFAALVLFPLAVWLAVIVGCLLVVYSDTMLTQ